MSKKFQMFFALLLVFGMILSACGTPAAEPAVEATEAPVVVVTEAPVVVEETAPDAQALFTALYAELPAEFRNLPVLTATVPALNAPLDDAERSALLAVLEEQHWHITRSAKQLGISRNTLYRKLSKHDISPRG